MLTIKYIIENKEEVIKRLSIKGFEANHVIENAIELDNQRKATQNKLDGQQAELNNLSKEIGNLIKQGKSAEAEAAKAKTNELKESIKSFGPQLAEFENELIKILVRIPNVPSAEVPAGNSAKDNVVVKECGTIPVLPANALPHWELTSKYDIVDFELGVKITGAGFPVYKNKGAKLQRALINFFLDNASKQGYIEIQPPIMINHDSGFGTGQLPDKDQQMYYVTEDQLYLIPTAEVPVTNIYRDVIVDGSKLPIKNTAYTPCFRREAGSYGKEVRGLNRLHQFDKVEIVQIAHPEKSYQVLGEMVSYVESLLVQLELPYRILKLCGGDMSFTSALTYDFEVYSAAQKLWLEVSSVSNFESYQANRLKLRFKEAGDKKTQMAHTLNGSALALPRIVASLLENNQTEQGITIPKALRPYTGFDQIDFS